MRFTLRTDHSRRRTAGLGPGLATIETDTRSLAWAKRSAMDEPMRPPPITITSGLFAEVDIDAMLLLYH